MAFDDRGMDFLPAVGCLTLLCGLLALVLERVFGWWAATLAIAPPFLLMGVFEILKRLKDNRHRRDHADHTP